MEAPHALTVFFLEPFSNPAVEMVNSVDLVLAFGREPRDHQRHRGAPIRRHDWRASQLVDALACGGLAIERICAPNRAFPPCMKRFSEYRLVMAQAAAWRTAISAIMLACRSVGKPENGAVPPETVTA